MRCLVRAGLAAALVALVFSPALAADKAFKQSGLDEAAIKLEAQIKSDAGSVSKPAATLRRDADAAFQKNDFRTGMLVLGQLVAAAPDDATSWLRLSRAVLQIKPRDDREKALLLDRASTAAYIAYQRARDRNVEADSLSVLGRTLADRQQWRGALDSLRLSLELRETADLRGQYEKLRAEHGFRLLDYTVDSDSISPRACFQFSEELPGRRTDFSPFVAVAGIDRPAIVGKREAALRRRPQARRTLRGDAARGPAVGRQGNAGEIGRVHDLRARPQAVRALFRQGLCAAAHRPARHSGAQRQYPGGDAVDLSDRRPQSDRYASRLRLPAQPEPLSGGATGQRARRQGLERRTCRRVRSSIPK